MERSQGRDIVVFVNNKQFTVCNPDPETTLLTYLREELCLTGTKYGCGEGGCGVCTVMVSSWNKETNTIQHLSINSCIAPLVMFHHHSITTVEGIGTTNTQLHAVQERLANFHGSQCGYCTPGMVMSMYTLLRNKPSPTPGEIDEYLQGNLCRCTGYRPILAAFQSFSTSQPTSNLCALGESCCRSTLKSTSEEDVGEKFEKKRPSITFQKYDPTQEPIFPPKLKILIQQTDSKPEKFVGERCTLHMPKNLLELLQLKKQHADLRIVGGNTEIGIETTLKGMKYKYSAFPKHVKEMNEIEIDQRGIKVGSLCTLTNLQTVLVELRNSKRQELQVVAAILEMLKWFGGEQIRNVATLGGNIMTASPISDINPILVASSAKLIFARSKDGKVQFRECTMDQNFFTSYRTTSNAEDEILISILIPFTLKNSFFKFYKQSKRRDDDIAIVNATFHLVLQNNQVDSFITSFGGVADKTVVVKHDTFAKRTWNNDLLEDILNELMAKITIPGNAPGGMVDYRKTLVQSLFFKFFIHVMNEINGDKASDDLLCDSSQTYLQNTGKVVKAKQSWEQVPSEQPAIDKIGRPMLHESGLKHVTGESIFVDDINKSRGELYMALIMSTEAHARIVDVDISEAESQPGFVSYIGRNDVPGSNIVWRGDTVFADGEVTCVGHIIGGIVADTETHARRAAQLVKVKYEKLEPVNITIEDAIKHSSYYEPTEKMICFGDVEKAFSECDHVLSGEVRSSTQDHFYLEPHACIVIPKQEGEFEVVVSSQSLSGCHFAVAACLGVPANKVNVHVKRVGGAFGGKETRSFLLPVCAAVASKKCNKAVRCVLSRHEDMQITGNRHPFWTKYKVGFNKDGKIVALDETVYTNGGNTVDLSHEGLAKFMTGALNSYNVPNVRIRGFVCKTNTVSTTCFRGFGVPQATFVAETWITHVASYLNLKPEMVRELNFCCNGDTSHVNQIYEHINVKECWSVCIDKSKFKEREKLVQEFNNENRWKKRGISCIPVIFGVGFPTFMNQAGALVSIYVDGSVIISHGGIEMGQGLYSKMIQIASRVLEIDCSKIHISENNTAIIPNTSPTAGSISSDLYGMAVKQACDVLKTRLQPLQKENPDWAWERVIGTAFMQRIQLFATGFYSTPEIDQDKWNLKTGEVRGKMFVYHICGAAVSEVEIDCLTGNHVVLQTDIVMGIGRSLNPAVDIGQIEGSFVQGYGMMTLEDPLHGHDGKILTLGTSAYKIPCFDDVPRNFNVHILPTGQEHDKAIYSSKGVGEPPLCLAASVFFAIKHSIESARKQNGIIGYFDFNSPASAERIRMACSDKFTKTALESKDNLQPWAIRI